MNDFVMSHIESSHGIRPVPRRYDPVRFMTYTEAGALLGVSESRVGSMAANGEHGLSIVRLDDGRPRVMREAVKVARAERNAAKGSSLRGSKLTR